MAPDAPGARRLAIVTGAASGIGRATALLLAGEGRSVVACTMRKSSVLPGVRELLRRLAVVLMHEATENVALLHGALG